MPRNLTSAEIRAYADLARAARRVQRAKRRAERAPSQRAPSQREHVHAAK